MKINKFTEYNQSELVETFEFLDVYETCEFVKRSCDVFNELDHHPNYFLMEGKFVTIKTSTHTENAVTEKDRELIERLRLLVKECCKKFNPQILN